MSDEFDPFLAEWISFAKNQNFNLVEKSLKLAQILEYKDLKVNEYIEKIRKMGKSLTEFVDTEKNPTYRISMLNEHLFQNLGYHGDLEDYYNPKNNFLNDVIDKRSGIPITLSILYVEIAKHLNLDMKILGFPSHILVKFDEEIILDPFYDGRRVGIEEMQEILDRNFGGEVEFEPEFLATISNEEILARICRNLKNSYAQSYQYDKALRCTNMVLTLEPDSSEDIRDKGILLERMLKHEDSLFYLNKYLETSPNAEDVDFVLEIIREIREKASQL